MKAGMRWKAQMAMTSSPSFMPSLRGLLQRKCGYGGKEGASECEESKKDHLQRSTVYLQPKLAISESGNAFEQEADRFAEAANSDSVSHASKLNPDNTLDSNRPDFAPPIVDEVLQSSGLPLDGRTKARMTQRFGYDFGRVRVHTDARANESAESVNAQAYTVRNHIAFGQGRYAPATVAGQKLLAHELAHVVQQSSEPIKLKLLQRKPAASSAKPSLEESDKSWIKAFGLEKWLKGIIRGWRDVQELYEAATAATFRPTEALLTGILTASRSQVDLGEEQIKTQLNGDPARLKEFHDAYYEMISTVLPKFASLTKKNLGDVVQAHVREIPQWALNLPALRGSLVPGLGPEGTQQIEDAIKAGKYQDAIDRLVGSRSEIKVELLADKRMTFDPFLRGDDANISMASWDYIANKADPPRVKIGPSAFRSVSYLTSVILHEYQHVLWQQTLSHQQISKEAHEQHFESPDEVEAGAWEILHAKETGLATDPEHIAQIWNVLNSKFEDLDQVAQKQEGPLVLRAFQQAKVLVKGSGHNLTPMGQ